MQKPDVWKLVLARLVPSKYKEREINPTEWRTYVNRCLVPEIRSETIRFYGNTDCIESQNPGLDYAMPAHRLRLKDFPHHRILFNIFDELRLTDNEIQLLCKWAGTKRAKEKYEAENCIKIRDTTWDDIEEYEFQEPTATIHRRVEGEVVDIRAQPASVEDETSQDEDEEMEDPAEEGQDDESAYSEEDSEDELEQSVGVELNERLLAATEARARGEAVPIDPAYEQWLKETEESGIPPPVPNSATARVEPAVHWGREIPEIFSENPRPHIAAMQARLPPPPRYDHQVHSSSSLVAAILRPSGIPVAAGAAVSLRSAQE